jgi:hypothetical protein
LSITFRDSTYVINGNTSADVTGDWVSTHGFDEISFQASVPASGGGSWGTIYVDGTSDPLQVDVQPCAMYATTPSGTPSFAASFAIAGTSEQKVTLVAPYAGFLLPEFVRLRYVRSSSGAANQLNVFAIGRR